MNNAIPRSILAASVMISVSLGGCGGGGSSTSSTPANTSLAIASKVSVVDTSSSGQASLATQLINPLVIGPKAISPGSLPANSDYNTDTTQVYVEERSAEAFDIINEILCSLGQTRYDSMLNLGDYKAQIDLSQCSSGNDDASKAGQSSQNQSSGSTQPDYEFWVVNSSRADGGSPHIVKAWIHEEANSDSEPEKMMYAKLTITEAVSATNPYGIFTLYFAAHPVANGVTDESRTMFRGYLKSEEDATGKVLLKFIADGGFDVNGDDTNDMTFTEKVTVDRSGDGQSGGGSTSMSSAGAFGSESASYAFAFNPSYFLRRDALGAEVCLNRTSYDETAWRYGMYGSSGARVNRISGFPLKYTNGGTDYFGWIGYWGLWFPDSVSVPDGATVYKMNYGSGATEVPYSVARVGGKLKKHTRKTMTLGEIKGIPLQMHDNSDNNEYRIEWNGTSFLKTAVMNRTTWLWEDISPQETLDLTALNQTELYLWSEAMGGSTQIKLDSCSWDMGANRFSCSASDASVVIVYLENMVYPTDTVPSTFACFENCPDPASLTGADPFFDTSAMQNQNVPPDDPSLQYVSYAFSASDMKLKSSGTPVIQSAANNNYEWGTTSGPLFEPSSANLAQLACSWDTGNTCSWQARSNLDSFYTWETGINNWNQFTALRSGSAYLTFDTPLSVKYARTVGSDTSTYFLQYAGFGELWGIPGKCVNKDTGGDTACGPDTRWIPEFSIPAGATLVNASDNATEYIVKPLEKEQRMQSVGTSNCTGLTLTSYTLPDISEFQVPDIGTRPTVTAAPAVIGGVLQQ